VDRVVTLAADVKAIVGGDLRRHLGADWTRNTGAATWSMRTKCVFRSIPLWRHRRSDAIGIDYYAPLADWRDNAGALDPRAQRQRVPAKLSSPAI